MTNGVRIVVAATPDDRDLLISRIRTEHPRVAYIHRISYTSTEMDEDDFDEFTITPSHSESDEVTQVSPDIAVCADCMRDRTTQPHRIGYPFINCTHCGPRFSIIRDLPYDRSQTTMGGFLMCPDLRKNIRMVSIAVSMPNRSLAIIVDRLITRHITRRLISIMRPY